MDPAALEVECQRLAKLVARVKDLEKRRASKRQIRKPIEDAAKLAEKLEKLLPGLPAEFFAPVHDPEFLDRLSLDLLRLRFLATGSPLTAGDGGALAVVANRKQTDARKFRHGVIGDAVAIAYERLAGRESTCYTGSIELQSVGTFPTFLREIAPRIGLTKAQVSAVIEHRRSRYRSRKLSAPKQRALARRKKRTNSR